MIITHPTSRSKACILTSHKIHISVASVRLISPIRSPTGHGQAQQTKVQASLGSNITARIEKKVKVKEDFYLELSKTHLGISTAYMEATQPFSMLTCRSASSLQLSLNH